MNPSSDPTLPQHLEPPLPAAVPQRGTLGRYRLLREIGRGGHAVVYEALDPDLDRRLALKVLPQRGDGDDAVRRLQREAAVIARLSHPGILQVHEAGRGEDAEAGELHYIAMTLVDGTTLAQALPELAPARRIEVLIAVAEAVGHAHARGVVHRDLKPSNVLLGRDGRVYVGDFGLARWSEATRLTESGAVLGTAYYMAPEQVRGETSDARTDVWAMGVMLYELLTRRRPFESHSAAEVLQAILHHDPTPPRAIEPGAPRALEQICLRAMSKSPRERYPDGQALADDLRRQQQGTFTGALGSSALHGVRRRVRRHPLLVSSLVLLALGGGLAGRSAWQRAATTRRQAACRDRARTAFDAGRWAEALGACERGLALGADPLLTRLRDSVRERQRREQEGRRARLQQAKRFRALQQLRGPLEGQIERTRQMFYIRQIDIRAKLDELDAALQELERRIAGRPVPDGIHTLLGVGWYLVGRTPRAEQALRLALVGKPDDGRARHYLGRICLERSLAVQLARVRHDAQRTVALSRRWSRLALEHLTWPAQGWSPRPVDRQVAAAYRALAEGDRERVMRLCREGRRRFAAELGAEEFWTLEGWVTPGDAALALWRQAIERRPHYAWGEFSLGLGHLRAARWTEALAAYGRALRIDPHLALAHASRGVVHLVRRRSELALADFDQALRLDPRLAGVHYNRGMALYELRRSAEAIQAFGRAIALVGHFAEAHAWRGAARDQAGDEPGALAEIARALQINPRTALAYKFRGNLHTSRGRWREGVADFDRAIALDPRYAGAYNDRGNAWRKLQQPARALADLERAIALDPKLAVAWFNRGGIKKDRRDFSGALADYDRAIALDPQHAGAWSHRGNVRLQLGRADGAIADYDRAIALDPDHARHYLNRATARYYAKRDLPGALADYQKALALDPRDWRSWSAYAYCLQGAGKKAQAIAALKKARALAPGMQRMGFDALIREMEK